MGTAALLNVPASLEKVLRQLQAQGYDLGDAVAEELDGKALVAALKVSEFPLPWLHGSDLSGWG